MLALNSNSSQFSHETNKRERYVAYFDNSVGLWRLRDAQTDINGHRVCLLLGVLLLWTNCEAGLHGSARVGQKVVCCAHWVLVSWHLGRRHIFSLFDWRFGAWGADYWVFLANSIAVTSLGNFEEFIRLKKGALAILVAEGVVVDPLPIELFKLLLVIKLIGLTWWESYVGSIFIIHAHLCIQTGHLYTLVV